MYTYIDVKEEPAASVIYTSGSHFRSRPKSGARGVWRRVAKRFYGELDNYKKIKKIIQIRTEISRLLNMVITFKYTGAIKF